MSNATLRTIQITRRFTDRAWGGTETVVLETSRRMKQLGHQAEILTTTALDPKRCSSIRGVRVRRYPYFYPWLGLSASQRRKLDERGGNLFSVSLGRALVGRSPDLIHLHTGKRLGGIGRTVARLRNIPYVVSLHGGVVGVPEREVERWTPRTTGRRGPFEWGKALGLLVGSRRVLEDAAAVLCVDRSERDKLRDRMPYQRVEWMPNGVDTASFASGSGPSFRARHGIPLDRRVLTVVGRVDAQKNQMLAVKILARLRKSAKAGDDWHLCLVGPTTDGDYARRLERSIERRGLGDRVTWIPGLPSGSRDLVDAYHAADYVLVPSVHEPFGIVVLEAWAAGRPVVARRIGGMAELVQDGADGSLVDGDDVESWVRRISELEASPVWAQSRVDFARKRVRLQFDWQRITGRLLSLYEEARRAHSASQP
ncbi:MAG: glycosyltransferase family 4 protein [Thermoanaerobaculia bacterium]|nr:glycosyltransferase family 4 protein [Thermoanaerobaculia bacterium]